MAEKTIRRKEDLRAFDGLNGYATKFAFIWFDFYVFDYMWLTKKNGWLRWEPES